VSEVDSKKVVYIRLDEDLVNKIDTLRKTEYGEIDRSEFIARILKKALEMEVRP
jgi:metal-responsive CopG/Arc/MetJ family transcriptional regulator